MPIIFGGIRTAVLVAIKARTATIFGRQISAAKFVE